MVKFNTYILLIFTLLKIIFGEENYNYFFCNGKIYASDKKIGLDHINQICEEIIDDYRILILIKKEIQIIPSTNIDNYYTRDSEDFFIKQCNILNKQICDYGFMISIYTNSRKIKLIAGSVSKNIVSLEQRNNIINSMKNYLAREKYSDAIQIAVGMIQSYSPLQNWPKSGNNPNYQPNSSPDNISYNPNNPMYIPPQKKEEKSSGSFGLIFLFVICPLILCCIYFMFKKDGASETTLSNSADAINVHLNKLEHLLNDIKKNSPPVMSINICLICMQRIQFQNNLNNFSTSNNDYGYSNNYSMQNTLIQNDCINTRYVCGHVYHSHCLNSCNLHNCTMCPTNSQASMTMPNSHDSQVVDENNVKNFIKDLNLIYEKDRLQEYARQYPQEFSNFNKYLALGLVGVWGITAVATAAYMMSEMDNMENHNNDDLQQHQQYSNYNNIQTNNYNNFGNDELDTAEGDY
jgi:hypothetical protein